MGCGIPGSKWRREIFSQGEQPAFPCSIGLLGTLEGRPAIGPGIGWSLIPLVPYFSFGRAYPYDSSIGALGDTPSGVSADIRAKVEDALEEAFKGTGMFRVKSISEARRKGCRLTLRPILKEASVRGGLTFYGLSVFGVVLWYLGLPGGTESYHLKIDFQALTLSGEVVWEYTLEKSRESKIIGAYYGGASCGAGEFAKLLRDSIPELREGLRDVMLRLSHSD